MFWLGITIGLVVGVVFNATILKWEIKVKNTADTIIGDAKADVDKIKTKL